MTLADWQRAGRTFAFDGLPIFYRREGAGPTMVLLHGFPTASWDWHAVWGALTARHDVVAPDLLGFGFSAKPRPYPYSLMNQTTMVEALLESLGIGRYHLIAHDYGDSVAQELLARQRERTDGPRIVSACLLNGGIIPGEHRPLPVQRLLMSPVGGLLSRVLSRRTLRRSFDRIFGADTRPTDAEVDDFWSLVERDGGRRVMPLLIRYMREREEQRERWVGALREPGVPLRLIVGMADPISGAHVVTAYRALVERADVVALDGVGHYPQIEAPREVAAAILAHVEGRPEDVQ